MAILRQARDGYNAAMDEPIEIAVSACLAGQAVRYDGSDKGQDFIRRDLTPYFRVTPLCPEVAIGMGVPRPPIQVVRNAGEFRARGIADPDVDVSDGLREYACQVAEELGSASGYIFKARSPSCGLGSTPWFENDQEAGRGDGLYAHELHRRLAGLPMVEESGIQDKAGQRRFLERVLTHHLYVREGCRPDDLLSRHGLALLALNPDGFLALSQSSLIAKKRTGLYFDKLGEMCSTGNNLAQLSDILKKYCPELDTTVTVELAGVLRSYVVGVTTYRELQSLLRSLAPANPWLRRQAWTQPEAFTGQIRERMAVFG